MEQRRKMIPPTCPVFTSPYHRLVPDHRYRFEKDPEARDKLPDIIDMPVYAIAADFEPSEEFVAGWAKPRTIGVVFSGGPAPGGHNVIAGIFDAAQKANPQNRVIGFLLGPDGVIENEYKEITQEMVDEYRNMGGFGMIKTGRTKIDTKEKMERARKTLKNLGVDALVIIGGDDSNTNAAFLAQHLFEEGIQVLGVPKTIDGDIQVRDADGNVLCAMSFGFHTAARSFARAISNLCTDASSDVKYWHICKVMGRVASHLALEVALQAHPNITLIGEDLADYVDESRIQAAEREGTVDYTAFGMTLRHLSRVICDAIVRRAAVGKNYGVIVIPEGVLEFINEIQVFIIKLNTILAEYNQTHDTTFHEDFPLLEDKLEYLRRLARRSREDKTFTVWNTRDDDLFNDIPAFFQEGLLMERDSHGNFPFSQVETDKVIMGLVKDYLKFLQEEGVYKIGVEKSSYEKIMAEGDLDPAYYGPILFENWPDAEYLLMKKSIMSIKTLTQELSREGALDKSGKVPPAVLSVFKKSQPKFKTQTHFFGYDGRGNDPTHFDCTYTYNLGLTAFSLIANQATGVMAVIKNLEKGFDHWEPLGVPIAPLMHLEERKGKLDLVLEKTVVDVESPAFQVVKAYREEWLAAYPGPDPYRNPGAISLDGQGQEVMPLTLAINHLGAQMR
ncbi:MAG: 6-phosphofructokinase [Deltaproteobacteria bacterium]|nr:6-phosphofructokinase [Deltaproteobacteria bacterium]